MTAIQTEAPRVVSRAEWLTARKALLQQEKELTYRREELAQARRQLPRVRINKTYTFVGKDGPVTLADLFEGRSQLLVYHFMFHPDWVEGCKSCSYVADHFEGMLPHLAARDVSFVAISRARLEHLQAFKRRLGWNFRWVSSFDSDFNFDYHVSFTADELGAGDVDYNYRPTRWSGTEAPGISVFMKDGERIYHTYSTYERGLDMLNVAYHYIDLVPKGRDEGEGGLGEWVHRRDEYPDA